MKEEKIIIYGAGNYGQKLYQFLEKKGVKIDFFCETHVNNEVICGIPVISRRQLIEINEKVIVLIGIADKTISSNISKYLKKYLWEMVMVIECGEFIKKYLDRNQKYCIVCNEYIKDFEPHGVSTEIHQKYDISGNGYREKCVCPKCGSIDRRRWVIYVLKNYTTIVTEKCNVLHFAPTREVSDFIHLNKACDYYSGDIVSGRAKNVVNVLDIQFKDGYFDYIVINHVLEHIKEESTAINELIRVLKPTGKLIMSFPVCLNQPTNEKLEYNTPELRFQHYGYEDHYRLYGMDFKNHFEKYGLEIQTFTPNEICSEQEIERYGFLENDIILICSKNHEMKSFGGKDV